MRRVKRAGRRVRRSRPVLHCNPTALASICLTVLAIVWGPSLLGGVAAAGSFANTITSVDVCTSEEVGFFESNHSSGFDNRLRKFILEEKLGLHVNLTVLPSQRDCLYAVRRGHYNLGWGPFHITTERDLCVDSDFAVPGSVGTNSMPCPVLPAGGSLDATHECCVDFSVPYAESTVSLMIQKNQGEAVSILFAVATVATSPEIINPTCVLWILLGITSHVVYFAERRSNDEFPPKYLDGIDDAMWWGAVTVTTVGYGDKVPITRIGRVIAFVWMFVGIFMYSIVTGVVTAKMNEHSNTNTDVKLTDLGGQSVCTFAEFAHMDVFSVALHDGEEVYPLQASTLDECYAKLMSGEVAGIVDESLRLRHFMHEHPAYELTITHDISPYTMGLVYPDPASSGWDASGRAGSILRARIDTCINSLMHGADRLTYETIDEEVFGGTGAQDASKSEGYNTLLLSMVLGFTVAYVLAQVVSQKDAKANARKLMRSVSSLSGWHMLGVKNHSDTTTITSTAPRTPTESAHERRKRERLEKQSSSGNNYESPSPKRDASTVVAFESKEGVKAERPNFVTVADKYRSTVWKARQQRRMASKRRLVDTKDVGASASSAAVEALLTEMRKDMMGAMEAQSKELRRVSERLTKGLVRRHRPPQGPHGLAWACRIRQPQARTYQPQQ